MPDWDHVKYAGIKTLIVQYIEALNSRDFVSLSLLLTDDCAISRGSETHGKENVIILFKELFNREHLLKVKFELFDATAGIFSDNEAEVILYTKIFQDDTEKEIFIESLRLIKSGNLWQITRIFGLSYEPKFHSRHFESFL